MTKSIYVDQDVVGGSNNGTSKANAYNSSAGLQSALDDLAAPATENAFIYIYNSGASDEYTITTELLQDSGGSVLSNSNDYWVKVVGCDSSGEPITVKGTRVKIRLTSSSGSVWTFTGGAEISRVAYYNMWFHGGGNCANAFDCENDDVALSHWYAWLNCEFSHATAYGLYTESDFRGTSAYDCYFHDNDIAGLFVAALGFMMVSCKAVSGSSGSYAIILSGARNYHFYDCIFDANGRSWACFVFSFYLTTFINCVFRNATVAAINAGAAAQFINCINCIVTVATPSADYGYLQELSTDGPAGLLLNNISTSTIADGNFGDHDDLVKPYKTNGNNIDDSTGDYVDTTNYDWNNRTEANKGLINAMGQRSMIGVENVTPAETQAVSKTRRSLIGSPVDGSF